MIRVRKSQERGHADHGWLNSYHTFSFGSYRDPECMGFRSLRVMNEDRVAPGKGFGTHAHDNMEIVSYVLAGELEHKDSLGNGEVLRPGEFQRISAGTGIEHSEFNPSEHQSVHFYQIWLIPSRQGIEPSYEQKRFDDEELSGALRLVASASGKDGSLKIHSDARIYLSKLSAGASLSISLDDSRHGWLQVLSGRVVLNEIELDISDAAAISGEESLELKVIHDSEVMFFDLA